MRHKFQSKEYENKTKTLTTGQILYHPIQYHQYVEWKWKKIYEIFQLKIKIDDYCLLTAQIIYRKPKERSKEFPVMASV